jgi:hypothetical protein
LALRVGQCLREQVRHTPPVALALLALWHATTLAQ